MSVSSVLKRNGQAPDRQPFLEPILIIHGLELSNFSEIFCRIRIFLVTEIQLKADTSFWGCQNYADVEVCPEMNPVMASRYGK